jgi:hypothetical protein
MREFGIVANDPTRSREMARMQKWVRSYLCAVTARQNAVGNRIDHTGKLLTQELFDAKDRRAHLCPFVQDALDLQAVFMDESSLDGSKPQEIEALLLSQLVDFKARHPAYDPVVTGKPAQPPALWKTFITVFPMVIHSKGPMQLFEDIHGRLKLEFIKNGMMLGQFYFGCPVLGIHNSKWASPLWSPHPAFALRYMVGEDILFNQPNPENFSAFRTYFPP